MKKTTKILLSVAAISLFAVGCATTGSTVSDESLSLRKANVHNENSIALQKVTYTKAAPGTAKTYKRSYVNAPPLIPHSVEGLVPITKGNNACLGCHLPSVAKSVHATPIPPSHFVSFRPKLVLEGDKVIKEGKVVAKPNGGANEVFENKLNKLYPGRYNCTQCHVVQSNAKPLVKNTFKPDYTSPALQKKSDLLNVINQGVNTD